MKKNHKAYKEIGQYSQEKKKISKTVPEKDVNGKYAKEFKQS